MIEVIPQTEAPSYEELEQSNAWLRGRLREARRSYLDARAWVVVLAMLLATVTVLLGLTWAGVV